MSRYSRQVLFVDLAIGGQRRLMQSRAVLFGCGALGTVIANTLVRAGLGHLKICDRDFIELDNLQRQVLFDESDIAEGLPKAEAAARTLSRINSEVCIEPAVIDVNPNNIERLSQDAQILLDGTDNFETRFLINDLAVKTNRPWLYGAVIGSTGLCMTIVPGRTPCLRCIFDQAPPPEMNPTCDTAGVLGSIVNIIGSLQAAEAIKILSGREDAINPALVQVDIWTGRWLNMNVATARPDGVCSCCGLREFSYLNGKFASATTTLCGRDAVQINPGTATRIDLAQIARKLGPVADGEIQHNRFMLRARVGGHDLTLFPDGRAIIKGTKEPEKARSLYAKYLGA
ncbi:MAG: ThiF family adenylyltransferase [Planctomycetes bacterium]|nr:ThiF family adenylyltransferase [Planctomycetota bacterium]